MHVSRIFHGLVLVIFVVRPSILTADFVSIEEVPWVVFIQFPRRPSFVCTGAIISESWVLTSATCLLGMRTYQVFAGLDNLLMHREEFQVRSPTASYVHPTASGTNIGADIGLIEVDRPWNFTVRVKKLLIDGNPWPSVQNSMACTVAGWGNLERIEPFNVNSTSRHGFVRLRRLSVTGVHGGNNCPCGGPLMNKHHVCLKETGTGICYGDSGASLVCANKSMAVASYVYSLKRCKMLDWKKDLLTNKLHCEDHNTKNAFHYLCHHLNWIKSFVEEVPPAPEYCSAPSIPLSTLYAVVIALISLTQQGPLDVDIGF